MLGKGFDGHICLVKVVIIISYNIYICTYIAADAYMCIRAFMYTHVDN